MDLSLSYYRVPLRLLDLEMRSWLIAHAESFWMYGDDLLVAMPLWESLIFRIKYSECLRTL